MGPCHPVGEQPPPSLPAIRQLLQQETNQWVQVNICRKKSLCGTRAVEWTRWKNVERPVEFLNLQNYHIVSSCQSLQYIFSSFFTLLASAFLRAGGEVAIISISLRETACVKGFVGQRESAGAGGLREQYRQISRGRIICASWEAGGRVGEGVRQMEGLAV